MLIKLVAISDSHGNLPGYLPKGDILVIAGDICPDNSAEGQLDWLDKPFRRWLNKIKGNFGQIIMTWGNHDFVGEQYSIEQLLQENGPYTKVIDDLPVRVGCHSPISSHGISFFVSPYCKSVGRWAFGLSEETYARLYYNVGYHDVLVCHGPPFGLHDSALRLKLGWSSTYNMDLSGSFQHVVSQIDDTIEYVNTGSEILKEWIMQTKPKLVIFGHIHEGYGFSEIQHEDGQVTVIANVAQVDRGGNYKDRPVEIFLNSL